MTRRSRTNVDSYGPIKGRTIPMDTLDTLIGSYLEERLLAPDRLSELLAGLLKRRAEHVARQKTRIADLKKQAADAEAKLTRLYEAIENGLAALDDANLKGRIAELRRIRDAARADAERAEASDITPDILSRFAEAARKRIKTDDGSFRRHHLQALVQRVEVGAHEIRIKGSKIQLLRELAKSDGNRGVETSGPEVRLFVPKWLPGPD